MSTETPERAIGVAKQVLAGVAPDQLDSPTPCVSWDVRAVLNHLVGGSFFFAASTNAGVAPAVQLLEQSKAAISDGFRGDEPMPFGKQQEAGPNASAADQLAAFLGRSVA